MLLNSSFPSYIVPLFQNESSCKTLHMKMNLQTKHIFIWMVLHKTRFDTEAKGNSEMAYFKASLHLSRQDLGLAKKTIEEIITK